jgi:hypothetical protein
MSPFCLVERKSRHLLPFLCQKTRDSSTALGMTKWALTRDEPLSCRGFAALSIECQKLECRLTDTVLQSLC